MVNKRYKIIYLINLEKVEFLEKPILGTRSPTHEEANQVLTRPHFSNSNKQKSDPPPSH